jgi:hypothetical protein
MPHTVLICAIVLLLGNNRKQKQQVYYHEEQEHKGDQQGLFNGAGDLFLLFHVRAFIV